MDCDEAFPAVYVRLSAYTLRGCKGSERDVALEMIRLMFAHPERIEIDRLEVSQ